MSYWLSLNHSNGKSSRPIFVVVGMHRSGTSLCANILHALGVDMGSGDSNISSANARGHWERPEVVEFNDRIFAAFQRTWSQSSHVLSMPQHWTRSNAVNEMRCEAASWLSRELDKSVPFGFKDPRTTLLLDFWNMVFADVGVSPWYVFCFRNPAQVVRSLAIRDRMEIGQAECRWFYYNLQAIRIIAADAVCLVPFERWFDDLESISERLGRFVGLGKPSPTAIKKFVDERLRHDDSEAGVSSAAALRLWRLLMSNADETHIRPDLRSFAESAHEVYELVQPLLTRVEVLQTSVYQQNRVLHDLHYLIEVLRSEKAQSDR